MMNNKTITIYTLTATEAEQILRNAEKFLRQHVNRFGLRRLGSGWANIVTDGFGSYGHERKLRLFGITIEVPNILSSYDVMTYVEDGQTVVNCYAEYHFA